MRIKESIRPSKKCKKYLQDKKCFLPLQSQTKREGLQRSLKAKRELSSVGSERLPYKQRVGGSTPSAPTKFLKILVR